MEENQKQQVAAQGLRLLAASGTQPIKEESMSSEDPQDNPDNSFDSDTCSITSGMLDHEVVQGAKDYSSLELECQDLRAQLAESKTIIKHISVTEVSFQNNVDKVSYYTGLSSFGVLMVLVKLISPFLKRKCISPFQQLILTLSRLRLNLQIKDLSYRFGIHHSTVSRIFSDVIDILYVRLVPETIIWPEREEVKKTMPISFRETYPDCIGIIDCFEIFIEKSKDLKAKAQTWSNYKSHNTVKYLIAITPQGSISFISKGWGGRTSDKCLTDNSDLLNKLKPGDVLLADRGFDIKERMALYQCKVEIPAFTRGKKQLSMSEVQKTRELASQRIHVERVIGVLRNKYTLLQDTLPINMLQKDPVLNLTCVDKCVHVACALVNLSPSIVPSE